MMDAAAQRHDYAYYLAHTGGVNGALWNDAVGPADRALASAAADVFDRWTNGLNDTITGKPITMDEANWAGRVYEAFGILGSLKWIGNQFGH